MAAVIGLSVCIPGSGMTLTLTPSAASPGYVGQITTWQGNVLEGANVRYRFRVRPPQGDFQMIRDYGPLSSLGWTALQEGIYEIEFSAKQVDTGEVATTSQTYQVISRVTSGYPVVNPTSHPLVFLFSAPSCPAGARMRIEFQSNPGSTQETPWKSCAPPLSMNFYLAGLRAQSMYRAHAVTDSDDILSNGPSVEFVTGPLPKLPWKETILQPVPDPSDRGVLLGISGGSQIATDFNGNVVWYGLANLTWATRFEEGGYLWGVLEDPGQDISQQSIRKLDLVGMTVLETNAAQVNEQLKAMGRRPITGFHHEVRTLPGGRILALAGVEQILTDVQGPGPVDVMGDMILVFDSDLNVLWTWDAFDRLDQTRLATGGEVCKQPFNACPPFYLADKVNDWTHGNSVQLTADGNLLFSIRHQDWLVKINYANGSGDGSILWKLGKDGDFTFLSDDPYPWFSHQHDGNFSISDPSRLLVFDNGNLRFANASVPVHSRGQVLQLDERNRTASLNVNADLGVLSLALGTAQELSDGRYHFDAGSVVGSGGMSAYAVEVNACGETAPALQANAMLYRSFWMSDMYTPPELRKGARTRPPRYTADGRQGRGKC